MLLIAGLGNPGQKYLNTRHNAGWMFADELAEKFNLPAFSDHKKTFSHLTKNQEMVVIKPQTFMNESGKAVSAAVNFFSISLEQTYVVHDDLDIPLGEYKIQFATGPKIHNGVDSVISQLGTDQFWRVRIGVDSRNGLREMPGSDYVLKQLSVDEAGLLDQAVAKAVKEFVGSCSARLM